MTAGTGIQHSNSMPLKDRATHLLQIWILPEKGGLNPGYEQKSFAEELQAQPLVLVASRDGRQGSVRLHQDVNLYAAKWTDRGGEERFSTFEPGSIRVGSDCGRRSQRLRSQS